MNLIGQKFNFSKALYIYKGWGKNEPLSKCDVFGVQKVVAQGYHTKWEVLKGKECVTIKFNRSIYYFPIEGIKSQIKEQVYEIY